VTNTDVLVASHEHWRRDFFCWHIQHAFRSFHNSHWANSRCALHSRSSNNTADDTLAAFSVARALPRARVTLSRIRQGAIARRSGDRKDYWANCGIKAVDKTVRESW